MKRSLLLSMALLGLTVCAKAEDKPATSAPATTAPATTAPSTAQAAKPVNTKCPVSGDAIDPKGKTVDYKGQAIGFCCDDCVEPFKKNPEKYAKNIK